MNNAQIELTLRLGMFGENVQRVALNISPDLARDLTEPVELSDEPLSLLLASPGMFGGRGNAVEMRQRKFKLRRVAARDIAREIERELIRMFGHEDERDGYKAHDVPREVR